MVRLIIFEVVFSLIAFLRGLLIMIFVGDCGGFVVRWAGNLVVDVLMLIMLAMRESLLWRWVQIGELIIPNRSNH